MDAVFAVVLMEGSHSECSVQGFSVLHSEFPPDADDAFVGVREVRALQRTSYSSAGSARLARAHLYDPPSVY